MIIFVRSIFSAIQQLEEMDFARTPAFDKEHGCIEWRNKRNGDLAEIFFNKDGPDPLKRCRIDIYCIENDCSFKVIKEEKSMNNKEKKSTNPKSEIDKAWDEAIMLWKKSDFNLQHEEEDRPVENPPPPPFHPEPCPPPSADQETRK